MLLLWGGGGGGGRRDLDREGEGRGCVYACVDAGEQRVRVRYVMHY